MNITRIKSLLVSFLLCLTFALGGCTTAQQEVVQEEPIKVQRSKAKKAPDVDLERAPLPASAPAKESDDMERLD